MSELVTLYRRFQSTTDLEQKMSRAEELIRCIEPRLRLYIAASCPPEMVDDVVQETLIAIAKSLIRLRGQSEEEIAGWCYRIASRRLADKLRKRKSEPLDRLSPEGLQELEAVEEKPLAAGQKDDLDYALSLLKIAKPPCYNYLLSYYILGMDYAEMAEAFSMKYDAMRIKIGRCLKLANSLIFQHP
jgi:RNA polymerase sigma factor (sigma-70 family)